MSYHTQATMVNPAYIEDYTRLDTEAHNAIFTDLKDELLAMDRYISSIFKGNFIVPIIALVPAILFFFLPSIVAKAGCIIVVSLSILHYFRNRRLAIIKDKISEPETLAEQLERCQEYIEKLKFYYGSYTIWGTLGIYVGMLMIIPDSFPFFPFNNLAMTVGILVALYFPIIYECRKYQKALNHTEAKVQSALSILEQNDK